uniref:Obscurin-like protein 1 n=1 Tax=Acanthochromis polyacanthus TaxID=80966 RepID=A0A3Q1FZN4_9TELE
MDIFGGAPRVLGYPRPVLAQCGTDATLKCQIGGDPRPDVIWERKNVQILSEGRYKLSEEGKVYMLTITGVTQQDAGQYICKARNSIGETYAAASVNGVKFLIKPLSLRVDRGEDAAFSCKIWGTPLPEVTWEKDGKKLNDIFESSHFSVSNQDGGWFQLKIYSTRMPDKGVYTCKAINCHGEALAGAVLLVEPVPEREDNKMSSNGHTNSQWSPKHRAGRLGLSRVTEELPVNASKVKKFAVAEGKHAKFRCFVTGKPKPEIIWKKDGVPLEPDRRHLIFEDREGYYTLKVLYCKVQDTGLYVCAASNTLGNTLSAVHLTVKGPAVRFRRPLKDVEVKERDVAVLECEVPDESLPAAWYLEDQRLMPSSKYGMEQKGTKRRLTIHDVGTDDDGVYLCEMPDGAKSIAELSVKGTIVRKLPRKLEVLEGENAAFCVEVESDDMEVHWFKDGLKLHETHQTILKSFGKTHILVFVNVAYQDSGVVTFVAGRSKTSSRLKVKATRHCPPICPVGVKMDVDRPNSALLTWVPAPNSQTSTRSIFVLEMKEVGSQEWQKCFTSETSTSAEVIGDSVPCEGDYRFRVCCVNKYGRSGHVEFPKAVHLVPGPKIRSRLQSCEVEEGEDARFSIELSATMVGTWFLNSAQLQHSGRYSVRQTQTQHSLVIHEAQTAEDTAEITFIANGVRDSAVLRSEFDSNKKVEAGEAIVLYCEVSHPFAKVSWCKDGKELQVSKGLNIQSDGNMRRIVIQPADASHSGVYTCETSGDVIKFNVDVAEPPAMIVEPKDDVVMESYISEEIQLQCELSRSSGKVRWFKDGQQLEESDNIQLLSEGPYRRLTIVCGSVEDGGEYVCETDGDSVFFQLTVTVRILSPSESELEVTCLASERLELSCEISQVDAPVRWYRDSVEVEEGQNLILEVDGAHRRLVIPLTTVDDAGEYVCDTEDDSVAFLVTVTEQPVTLTRPKNTPDKLESFAGKPIVLEIEVSRPTAEVTWWLNGREIEQSSNVTITEDGLTRRLTIHAPTPEYSGKYTCDAVDDTIDFQVKVSEPPVKILRKSEVKTNLKFLISDDIVLECELSRANAATKWYKDGCRVEGDERFCEEEEGSFRSLVILNAELKDSGEYFMDVGDDSISFQVTVEEPPVAIVGNSSDPDYQEMVAGDDLILACEVSRPNAPVQWFCNDKLLTDDSRTYIESYGTLRKIIISCVTSSDSGKYVCDAVDDKMISIVRIQEPPVTFVNKEDDIVVTGYEAESVELTSYVSKDSALVRWMKDWTPVEGERFKSLMEGHKRTLMIEPLRRSDAGEYTCDVNTDQIHFSLLFTRPLQDTVAHADGMVTLRCEVCKPKADVQWLKNGMEMVPSRRFTIRADGVERSLTIHRLTGEDAGEYACESRDDRTVAKLKVESRKISIRKGLTDQETLERETASFEVELSHTDVEGVWQKDGIRVKPNSQWRVSTNGRVHGLTLSGLTLEDTGTIVFSAEGVRTSARLTVKEMLTVVLIMAPNSLISALNLTEHELQIVQDLEDLYIQEDQNAVFMCEVSLEDVTGEWFKDGHKIRPTSTIKTRTEGQRRKEWRTEDAGEIRFAARDVESTAYLEVEGLPVSIVKPLRDRTALEKHRVILECTVSSPRCSATWYKGREELVPTDRLEILTDGCCHKLVIQQVAVEDEGTYSVEVGEHTSKAKLLVEGK